MEILYGHRLLRARTLSVVALTWTCFVEANARRAFSGTDQQGKDDFCARRRVS